MLNKDLLRGHTKGEWKRFEYKLGSSRIYVEEPQRALVADVHKNRGSVDSDGTKRPDDEIVTVYNKCDSDLLFNAPLLLAEHDVLCELVEAQSKVIDALEYVVDIREIKDGGVYDDARAKITTLRGRLQG
jgi:hypothetical protein